jgi:DNA-binding transcriptional MerR regulator
MAYKEKEIEKIYYSIKEVSELLNVKQSVVRYWSNVIDEINPAVNKRGERFFSKNDLEMIKAVHHLVIEKGYTLEGVRRHFKERKKEIDTSLEVRNTLQQVRSFLQQLKHEL